ncbi:unnamed protein product [Ambrosiozyma monospora]|uniref:Unnamed protein product n=1 Tax=Ambrosiozyma monospora TaxID=43982 RepID=A0A9W6YNM0_AMBMO|nr:unnamed protein product [Ambrosiozyma monospora]
MDELLHSTPLHSTPPSTVFGCLLESTSKDSLQLMHLQHRSMPVHEAQDYTVTVSEDWTRHHASLNSIIDTPTSCPGCPLKELSLFQHLESWFKFTKRNTTNQNTKVKDKEFTLVFNSENPQQGKEVITTEQLSPLSGHIAKQHFETVQSTQGR